MSDARATNFLQLIRKSQRGKLKVYLGYGPGVGKTFQMLQEAHRLKRDGVDVVIGLVETHGRAETQALVGGLEAVALRSVEYRGIVVREMDVNAILARKPQVAIVDELAHSNLPGSTHAKRYQDVQALLRAGIHVISALNVQHLESLYDTVESLVGVKVRERLPDAVLAEADQIVNVDLSAEDLQRRLRDGKIYPPERIAHSLENFFTSSRLGHLREITLREMASHLDLKRREDREEEPPRSSEQVMVCLSSRGPNSARLLRYGSRLAGRWNRNWYAVYVQTPRESPTAIDAETQRTLADTLTLANQLGATVFTYRGDDVSETILRFAEEYRVGQIVIGSPKRVPWWRRLVGRASVAEQLVRRQRGVSIVVVDAQAPERVGDSHTVNALPAVEPAWLPPPAHVLLLEDPVSREEVISRLVGRVFAGRPELVPLATQLVRRREREGSTFINEGVALPHARVPGLAAPVVAIAIARAGILDADTEMPVRVVFLLLAPEVDAAGHLAILAAVGRRLRRVSVREALQGAISADEVIRVLSAGY